MAEDKILEKLRALISSNEDPASMMKDVLENYKPLALPDIIEIDEAFCRLGDEIKKSSEAKKKRFFRVYDYFIAATVHQLPEMIKNYATSVVGCMYSMGKQDGEKISGRYESAISTLGTIYYILNPWFDPVVLKAADAIYRKSESPDPEKVGELKDSIMNAIEEIYNARGKIKRAYMEIAKKYKLDPRPF